MKDLRASRRRAPNLSHQMLIIYRPIDQLKPDPSNPRPQQEADPADRRHIKTFGFNVPVLVDADLNVSAGHGRLLACRLLGITEVPTLCLDHLTPAQARALMISDNRLSEIATWDDRLLAQQLKDLSLLGLDFSIEVTGFDMGEIDLRIASLEDVSDQAYDPADALPEFSTQPPLNKIGDLWMLGRNRLLCGSALEGAAFAALMSEERASTAITDPPYNVRIDGHASGLGAVHHRSFPMASGEMDRAEFTAFLAKAFHNLAAFSSDGSLHYIFMDWRHGEELLAAGRDVYGELINLCVWTKHNAGMGSLYRSQHELVFVFKHGRNGHRNNVQLGQFGRNRSNVWSYPRANSFGRCGEEGNLSALHPTVKPVAMIADARSSTARRAATSCSTPFSAAARR